MDKNYSISHSLSALLDQMNSSQKGEVRKMIEFYDGQYKDLKKNHPDNQVSIAASFQETVQDSIERKIKETHDSTEHKISCAKGCSFCCFQVVDITDDEALLLTAVAKEEKIKIDYKKLENQNVDNEEFKNLSLKDSRCVFLNEKGTCSVYEYRPNSCRKYLVVTDSKLCDTEKMKGSQVGKLVDLEAEVLTCASLNATQSGSMAEMLLKIQK